MFYCMRKFLRMSQMIKLFKILVQPAIQFGVLDYGVTNTAILQPIDDKVNRIPKIIFKRIPFQTYAKRMKSTTVKN